jgi:hypothetical protein
VESGRCWCTVALMALAVACTTRTVTPGEETPDAATASAVDASVAGGDGGQGTPDAAVNPSDGGQTGLDASASGGVDAAGVDASFVALAATRDVRDGRFATSTACAQCHANHASATAMRDLSGNAVAPFDLWRATMMANAARDPFFRAQLSVERSLFPALAPTLEATCQRCHAPMASTMHTLENTPPTPMAQLRGTSDRDQLALDGVSCALCHQITATNLGLESSYGGNYAIGDTREMYGPHQTPFTMPMQANVNFTPAYAPHIEQSSTCATCHMLRTPVVNAAGTPTGATHLEQSPYLEWRASSYSTEGVPGSNARSCQNCHMDVNGDDGQAIRTRIARRPDGTDFGNISARSPYARHLIVGANTLIPTMLKGPAAVLQPDVPAAAWDVVIGAARANLRNNAAQVMLQDVMFTSTTVRAKVLVDPGTGHKFPTGYPSRRVFLRVRVLDAGNNVLWASGRFREDGTLLNGAGQPLPSEAAGGPLEPHRNTITSQDEVQIYESVPGDDANRRPGSLIRAARLLKDNRLLPAGFLPNHPDAAQLAPVGLNGDPDFLPGLDTVSYEVTLPQGGAAAARVEATLFYQVLGTRHANELFVHTTPEVLAFKRAFERVDRAPELVAETSVSR